MRFFEAEPSRSLPLLRECLLALGVSLYVALCIEPALRYESAAPIFQSGWNYLRGALSRPGAMLEYAAAFTAQLEFSNWLGALVLGILAGALFSLARYYLDETTQGITRVSAFALPIVLVTLSNRYEAPVFEIGLGLCLALALSCGYLKIAAGGYPIWVPSLLCWLMTAGGFLVAGLGSSLLFAFLVGCAELFGHRRVMAALICGLSASLVPAWNLLFPEFAPKSLVGRWGNGWSWYGIAAVCLVLPVMFSCLVRRRDTAIGSGTSRGEGPKLLPRLRPLGERIARWQPIGYSLFAVLGLAVVFYTFDPNEKAVLQIEDFARHRQWQKVLDTANRLTKCPPPARLCITRALFHTGRLGNSLYAYPLGDSLDLNPEMKKSWGMYLPLSDVMLELGQLNLAEHFGHEALELEGAKPLVLRQLIRIQTLKHRPEAADMFRAVLDRMPFQGDAVLPSPSTHTPEATRVPDEEAHPMGPLLVTTDYPASRIPTEVLLQQLLHTNRRNQMAFEYLMTHFLLTGQLQKFGREINRLKDFHYPSTPRYFEEALVLRQNLEGLPPLELQDIPISPTTIQRFEEFRKLFDAQQHGSLDARAHLVRNYGDTFWYHYLSEGTSAKPTSSPAKGQS